MRKKSSIDLIFKKTPSTFSAKQNKLDENEDESVNDYIKYTILADAAFNSILAKSNNIKTPKPMKKVIAKLSFKFKRYLVKQRAKKLYSTKNSSKLDERAVLAIKAFDISIKDPKNTLLISPQSGSRYVQTPSADVFIIIKYQTIILSNHLYYYEISISTDVYEYLLDKFDRMLESRRRQMERRMLENSRLTLEKAVSTLNNRLIKNSTKIRNHV